MTCLTILEDDSGLPLSQNVRSLFYQPGLRLSAKRRDQKHTGIDGQRQRVHFSELESLRTSSPASCPSAFPMLLRRVSVGGSIGSDSSSSAPQSSWELASFFCHYISKMTLFSNPAKADKYHQPVTSYISNSNTAASKSFYISISFAGSGR